MFMKQEMIESIKRGYPKGTRVELGYMNDPYTNLKPGDQGTVNFVDDAGQIHIKWDNGSGLALIPGEDSFAKVDEQKQNVSDPEMTM